MFDGLKDKLTGFTEDAEEDVEVEESEEDVEVEESEEDVEVEESEEDVEVEESEEYGVSDPDAAEADGTASESARDETGAEPTAGETSAESTAARTTPESTATAAAGASADTDPSGSPATSEAEAETAPASDPAASGETGEKDEADSGRSLTEKAKLFATGKTVIDEDDLESHLEDLEFALLRNDVEYEVTQEILDGVERNLLGETRGRLESTGNIVRDALREALYDVISVGQFDFDARVAGADSPVVIVFTGVNGVGKTTTIAKLARYFEERGLSTVLANGDTFRAGANEQLEQHARNLDKKLISHEQGSDPTAVIYDAVEYAEANDVDVVLGDTAGRLHTSDGLMDQLAKIDRVIGPDMTVFVDEAVAGQDAVNRAREFDDASNIDGTVLTKVDADTQGGAAISIAHVTGKPILFLGTGQDYDDLERFDPERIVDSLLGG